MVCDLLRGKSIGFLPLEMREPDADESALYPQVNRVITKSLLVEYSVVAVPSNPLALVEAINKGLTDLDRMGIEVVGRVKPKAKRKPAQVDFKAVAEQVVRDFQQRWQV